MRLLRFFTESRIRNNAVSSGKAISFGFPFLSSLARNLPVIVFLLRLRPHCNNERQPPKQDHHHPDSPVKGQRSTAQTSIASAIPQPISTLRTLAALSPGLST